MISVSKRNWQEVKLNQNIANFEKKNGNIKEVDMKKVPLDFGGPKAQA